MLCSELAAILSMACALDVAARRWVQFVLHYYALLGPFAANATLGATSRMLGS